jgi:hypothetical protein
VFLIKNDGYEETVDVVAYVKENLIRGQRN